MCRLLHNQVVEHDGMGSQEAQGYCSGFCCPCAVLHAYICGPGMQLDVSAAQTKIWLQVGPNRRAWSDSIHAHDSATQVTRGQSGISRRH